MTKKTLTGIFILSGTLFFHELHAQILKVSSGTSLFIKSGTIFSADSLTLTPSADFTLSNMSLSKDITVTRSTLNSYIARVYIFSSITNAFTGSVQINYLDGAELRGIAETALTINVDNGTNWNAFTTASRDITNNYVISNLSAVTLNELTLADVAYPLPLIWESFTANRLNNKVLLQWATAQEQNVKDFTVQYSTDGTSWNDLTTIASAGNSSNGHNYSYIHTNPLKGNNYYRILITDLDGKSGFSKVLIIKFDVTDQSYIVLGNPISNGMLTLKVNTALVFTLYSADGKLLWQKQFVPGLQNIDVSQYAKGLYLLKANGTTQKIIKQ